MRTAILKCTFLICTFTIIVNYSFSQTGNTDTSHILLSSPDFDYKNPQFDKTGTSLNYFIRDCILAYEKWTSDSNSIIAVRFMNYNSLGTETELTDNTSLNINPAVAYHIEQFTSTENNPGAVVFQSNRNGNWDIYISFYNSVSWSTPAAITSDPAVETEPSIAPYFTNNTLNYLVTYRKNNDIYLKNFYNGIWMDEINITGSDSLDCFSPEITKPLSSFQNNFYIAYNKTNSALINSISYQRITVNTGGIISSFSTNNISQPNSQNNIRFSNGINYVYLNYDYDTLGKNNFYSAELSNNNYYIFNQSIGLNGDNFCGTGSAHGDITSDYLGGYSVYSWINRVNDSTRIVVTNSYNIQDLNIYYVGDSLTNTFVNTSTKLVFPNNSFRIRILWEKKINGRTAFIESFKDDFLSSINNSNDLSPSDFSLSQNYPNPFNPETVIRYSISKNSFVKLKLYDVLGNEVSTLVNEKQNKGIYNYQLSTVNYQLPSGVYFYKLEAGDFSETKRMILLK